MFACYMKQIKKFSYVGDTCSRKHVRETWTCWVARPTCFLA